MKWIRWMEERLSGRKNLDKNSKHCSLSEALIFESFECPKSSAPLMSLPSNLTGHCSPVVSEGSSSTKNQRSRIKTNPWLRSPWHQPSSSYGSTNSTSSKDSGCGLLENLDHCNASGTEAAINSSLNCCVSQRTLNSSEDCDYRKRERKEKSKTAILPLLNCSERILRDIEDEDFSSRDDVISASSSSSSSSSPRSSSAFSSQSSSICTESEWSTRTLASPSSLASSGAIASASSLWSSNASLFSFTNHTKEEHTAEKSEQYPEPQSDSSSNRRPTHRIIQTRWYMFKPVKPLASLLRSEEQWVSTATDQLFDEQDEQSYVRCHKGSKETKSNLSSQVINKEKLCQPFSTSVSLDAKKKSNKLSLERTLKDEPSELSEQSLVPSPAPCDWTVDHWSDTSEDLMDGLLKYVSGLASTCSYSPTSPGSLTVDSGIGLSDAVMSSTNSPLKRMCSSNDNSSDEDEELDSLSDQISQLRLQLNSVDNAIDEDDEEEEGKSKASGDRELNCQQRMKCREVIEYKRLLLFKRIDQMKYSMK